MCIPPLHSPPPMTCDTDPPHLPVLARFPRRWTFLNRHGISINALYSRCAPEGPASADSMNPPIRGLWGLLVMLKDMGDTVFGVWVSEGWGLARRLLCQRRRRVVSFRVSNKLTDSSTFIFGPQVLWGCVGGCSSGQARTTTSHSANLDTSHLAAGTYTSVLTPNICFRTCSNSPAFHNQLFFKFYFTHSSKGPARDFQ